MNGFRRYPRPDLLDQVPQPAAVLEASAGTGKTWTLEHLVLDLLLHLDPARRLRLEEILVVTFGEKAAREMRERIRAKLRQLLSGDFEDAAPDEPHWLLDDAARAALDQALMDFDRSAISTIHAFCQRLLVETALLSGRPFRIEMVPGKSLFQRAVAGLVRGRWAAPGSATAAGLVEALDTLGGEDGLLGLLHRVHGEPGLRHPEAGAAVGLGRDFLAALDPQSVEAGLRQAGAKGNAPGTVLEDLDQLAEGWRQGGPGGLAVRWKSMEKKVKGKGWSAFLDLAGDGDNPAAPASRALQALLEALPSDEGRAVDLFLAEVEAEARAIKEREALQDFDDLLALAAEALDGPGGDLLAERVRGRHRAALIDEFQDTSPSQWRIFERIFLGAADRRLVLIGDPKQAIYGFRGGDIHTCRAAQVQVLGSAGPTRLTRNFRSTPAMIHAYNRILDQAAEAPFFQGPVSYPQPVTPGREGLAWVDGEGRGLPALRLVRVGPAEVDKKVGRVRRRLAVHLAAEVAALLALRPRLTGGGADDPLRPGDIFVLTQNRAESELMAEALRGAGVRAVFYKREGVFASPEAEDLLNLLRAVADPGDPDLRAKAFLSPVFGAGLADLDAGRDLPETHPAVERLRAWHALARARRFPDLFREVRDGGLLRRLLRGSQDDRSASVWLQLTEFALQEAQARHDGFDAFVAAFADLVAGRATPPGEEADVHRPESDQDAVQILTMHKAKGLEAKVVVLFGALSERALSKDPVHAFFDGARRRFWVGTKPPRALAGRILAERCQEHQRLLYVALTRAKAQMILPVYDGGGTFRPKARSSFQESGDPKGPYGVVNPRLRDIALDPGEDAVVVELGSIAAAPPPAVDAARRTAVPARPADLEDLARAARPVRTESFSSLSRDLKEHGRPDPEARPAEANGPRPVLPGGPATGTCLHRVLETVDLGSAAGLDLTAWMALPAVKAALDPALAEAGLEGQRREVARLAHGALVARYDLPGGGVLPGLAPLRQALREVEFLMPHPDGRDFLDGSIDLLFAWEGRTYFVDWKSNLLAAGYGPEACAAALAEHYDLQFRIYTLAVCAFLGVEDAEAYADRFGGGLYVFLRGLPGGGLTALRPTWDEVQAWRRDLAILGEEVAHGGR